MNTDTGMVSAEDLIARDAKQAARAHCLDSWTEEAYHNHPWVSNSDLKLLEDSPRTFREQKLDGAREDEEKSHYQMGTMLEMYLMQQERFENNFLHVPDDIYQPRSGKMTEFANLLVENPSMDLAEAYREAGYKNPTQEKAVKKYDKLSDWISIKKKLENDGLTSYDDGEKERLMRAAADVQNHDLARSYLMGQETWKDAWTQRALFAPIHRICMKGMLDRLVMPTDDVFCSIELKTTSKPVSNFPYHYIRYRYYRQQALYKWLVDFFASEVLGLSEHRVRTIVVAVRVTPPYGTRVWEVPGQLLGYGKMELQELTTHLRKRIEAANFDTALDDDMETTLDFDPNDIHPVRL